MKLTQRVLNVKDSPTLAITARANAMKASGVDVISFGAGEPDFAMPSLISDALKAALDKGLTRYTPVPGIPALRAAIAKDYARRGREVSADEVIVCVGGKHALYNATLAVFERGDRVIIPSPYWVSYPEQLELADASPVFVECTAANDFKLTAPQLDALLSEDASITGLILCSPSNPTGATYSAQELQEIGAVLARFPHVTVFFDAIYDQLYYDGDFAPDLVANAPSIAQQVITFNGFSKTYAMTGLRMGYAVGPKHIIAAMSKMQSQSTSNPTSVVQHAALAALTLDDATIAAFRDTFKARRDLIVHALRDIPHVTCALPQGAFYVFPDLSAYINARFPDDLALAAYLLDEAEVALVPGSAFGAPGFMRLSYAISDAQISEGIARIKAALATLS